MRDAGFDTAFLFGGLGLALLAGAAIVYQPAWFYPILIVDLWVLGYHHVIATFTRLCFDKESYKRRRWMVVHLIPIIAAITIVLAWLVGIWVIVTIYFYWQWFHYSRQSWGISRAYRRRDFKAQYEAPWLDQIIFYSLPVYGILLRSSEGHRSFIGLDLWTLPVGESVSELCGIVTAGLLVIWVGCRVIAAARGRMASVHTLYMATHFAIFYLGYVAIPDITLGWLLINIWHNFQYILFVWMTNNRRFKGGIDPDARFLSFISQSSRMWLYMMTCIAITGLIYWGVLHTVDWLFFASISATVVLYQIVNFHHYVVDGLIWKSRSRTDAVTP